VPWCYVSTSTATIGRGGGSRGWARGRAPGPATISAKEQGIEGMAHLTVAKATTSTSIATDTPDPSVVGQAVTVSFLVQPPPGDSLKPSGAVTIRALPTGESCTGKAPS